MWAQNKMNFGNQQWEADNWNHWYKLRNAKENKENQIISAAHFREIYILQSLGGPEMSTLLGGGEICALNQGCTWASTWSKAASGPLLIFTMGYSIPQASAMDAWPACVGRPQWKKSVHIFTRQVKPLVREYWLILNIFPLVFIISFLPRLYPVRYLHRCVRRIFLSCIELLWEEDLIYQKD